MTADIVTIGTMTPHGRVEAIMWIGERYYACIKNGVVSLVPAIVLEAGDDR